MTDEDAHRIYHKMVKLFGEDLPNPDHYPRAFEYFMKLYKHMHPEEFKKN